MMYPTQEELTKQFQRDFNKGLEDYLKKNLSHLGYTFDDDNDFLEFVKKNIIRVRYPQNPFYYELYLNLTSPPTLTGMYHEVSEITIEQNKVTALLGNRTLNLKPLTYKQ